MFTPNGYIEVVIGKVTLRRLVVATLRLAREINTSTNADFAPLQEECLSRLRTLAPPHWQEALAAQPKITPARAR